jgi:hypothetical protein
LRATLALAAALAGGLAAAPALAGTLTFAETGGDVVATLSGSLSLPVAQDVSTSSLAILNPSLGLLATGTGTGNLFPVSGPTSFGSGQISFIGVASSGTTYIRLSSSGLTVDDAIASGDSLQGSVTWSNRDFASLGLTPGTYEYLILDGAGGSVDTFTVQIGESFGVVPLPAAAWMLIAGLGGFAALRRVKA